MFSPAKFSPQVLYPCYGLAEATLMLTAKCFTKQNQFLSLNQLELNLDNVTPEPEFTNPNVLNVVNCGSWPEEHQIRIVDPNTLDELTEGTVGEVWASGPSIAQGYWNQPELTQQTFNNYLKDDKTTPYLRTGDLGFIHQGNLYITGRIKELIIINGMNYYPQDIEQAITNSSPVFELCSAAAFSIASNTRETLIILQEVKREAMRTMNSDELFSGIQAILLNQFGLIPQAILLLKPYSLPKTSSGKIQRNAAKKLFQENGIASLARWDNPMIQKTSVNQLAPKDSLPIKNWINDWFARRLNITLCIGDYEKTIPAMGLNSMAAVEFSNALQQQFDFDTDLIPLFEKYSLNQIIQELSQAHTKESEKIEIIVEKPLVSSGEENLNGLKTIYFNVTEDISNNTTTIGEKEYINFSGYNYLGLSGDPLVTEAVVDAVKKYGTSVSASRIVSGEKPIHGELEKAIAGLIGTDDCIVFPSGHSTNITIITHLFGPGDLIVHDELAHNSILQGALFSRADRIAFPHNDNSFIKNYLEKYRDEYNKVVIITEGVFSMDGDIPNIPELVTLKKQFDTYLMIDEAHSMGVIGNTGRGIREYFNLNPQDIDIWMGTLSKSFASCGGYIAGNQALINNLKYSSDGFIYSAGISPANTAAALAAINQMKAEPHRITKLHERQKLFLSLLQTNGFPTGLSQNTPIIPMILGEESKTIQISQELKNHHILALPIVYPAVEKNKARIRFFINCLHTEEQLYKTNEILQKNLKFIKNKSTEVELI